MEDAFGVILVVVVAVAAVAGIWAAARDPDAYGDVGGGPLALDRATPGVPAPAAPTGPAANAEREADIRGMLQARNARRIARGLEPHDVDAELAALLSPAAAPDPVAADPALAAEIRQLMVARNERRARAGKPPLDVEAEVARQLRDLR